MTGSPDRRLPNARVRAVMLAIKEEMGNTGLNLVLRASRLERFSGNLPPDDHQLVVLASEFSALRQAIENYFGRGSRGSLTRIGREAFQQTLKSRPVQARLNRFLLRFLPPDARNLRVLNQLAAVLGEPGGNVTVHLDDRRFLLVDTTSDATFGQTTETEVCWLTVGQIQEALYWATGQEHDVTEVACKAKGSPACRFEISEALE